MGLKIWPAWLFIAEEEDEALFAEEEEGLFDPVEDNEMP